MASGITQRKRQIHPATAQNGESDLLIGEPLVRFFFGPPASRRQYELDRRRVYHLARTEPELGIFQLGRLLAARKSRLNRVFAEREARGLAKKALGASVEGDQPGIIVAETAV